MCNCAYDKQRPMHCNSDCVRVRLTNPVREKTRVQACISQAASLAVYRSHEWARFTCVCVCVCVCHNVCVCVCACVI